MSLFARELQPVLHRLTIAGLATLLPLVALSAVPAPARADDGAVPGDVAAAPVVLKPALSGLVVTQPQSIRSVPYAEFASMKVQWSTIETLPGLFNFSSIDQVLVDHPDVRFRLRFMSGIHAPAWVKNDAGGCVDVQPDSINGSSGCVPRFWTDPLHEAYVALMRAVANRYEADPQVVEIANSECTTIYAEPFILGADSASVDRLWQAGYRKSLHEQCLRRSTASLMSQFPTTRISLAGHSKWQFISPGPGGPSDGVYDASWEEERRLLDDLTVQYGSRLVFDDHGLGPDDQVCTSPGETRETASSWYCYLSGLGSTAVTHGWQFTLNGGSMAEAAEAGVAMGACFLEFAAFQALDDVKRRQVHEELVANCADKGDPPTDPPVDPPAGTVVNEVAPVVTGEPAVGDLLSADPGAWEPSPETVEYQWLRDGDPMWVATEPTYEVRLGDVGHRLTVVVTAIVVGHEPGKAESNLVRVAKLDTVTTAWLPRTTTHSRHPKIVVEVVSVADPASGRVVITSHGHRVAHGWLDQGQVRIRLHRMTVGGHRLIARFLPTETFSRSLAESVRVLVRR